MKNDILAKLFDAYRKHRKITIVTRQNFSGEGRLRVNDDCEIIISFSEIGPTICFKSGMSTYALLLGSIKDVTSTP